MNTTNCCVPNRSMSRCHIPLITVCGNTTQFKLDLNNCGVCAGTPTALLLEKQGCVEYEVICTEPEPRQLCCGVVDNRPMPFADRQVIGKPLPSVAYPLLDYDDEGLAVFALDDTLKSLGYGRYRATILVNEERTGIIFDIDYIEFTMSLNSIKLGHIQPNVGVC